MGAKDNNKKPKAGEAEPSERNSKRVFRGEGGRLGVQERAKTVAEVMEAIEAGRGRVARVK